jgi:WD40 repeat protein
VLQLAHSEWIRSVVFTTDGRRLVSAAWDHTVKIWVRETPEGNLAAPQSWALLRTLVPGEVVNAVALSADGGIIACGSSGVTGARQHGRILLWDGRMLEMLRHLDGHSDQVRSLSFSPDGATLASGSIDGSVILWDVETWSPRYTLQSGARFVDSLAFSADSALIAAPQGRDAVLIWDARNGELQQRLEVEASSSGGIESVAFSPKEPLLAVGRGNGIVSLWDTRDWTLRHTLKGCRSRVFAVGFAPDGAPVCTSRGPR